MKKLIEIKRHENTVWVQLEHIVGIELDKYRTKLEISLVGGKSFVLDLEWDVEDCIKSLVQRRLIPNTYIKE